MRQVEAHGTSVSIHLTTSWRTILPLEVCRSYLGSYLSERTTHVVPRLGDGRNRASEVLGHLAEHGLLGQPWVCIDDQPSLFWDIMDSDEYRDKLLIIDDPDGIANEDKTQLVAMALQQIRE